MAVCEYRWAGQHRADRLLIPVRCCACDEPMARGTLVNFVVNKAAGAHYRHVGGRCESPDIDRKAVDRRKGREPRTETNATASNGEATARSATRAGATSPLPSMAARALAGTTRSASSRTAATRINP